MSEHFRVVVGIPSGQHWLAQFGVDLVSMVASFTSQRVPGYASIELRVVNVRSSILPKNRHDLVREAQRLHATHLLFLDTDHTFPRDLIHQLASHGKMVVAANCVTKQIPSCPTARKKSVLDPKGKIVYTDEESVGLEKVWRVGTGVMLVNMRVFEEIGTGVWDMKYLPEVDTYQGEDWSFCEACEKAGISIYVDHDVSKQIGHVGNYEFTHDVVGILANA